MPIPVFLAHGALGVWDEVIFVSVAVIFIVMMGVSWVRSRALEPDLDDISDGDTSDNPERFRLD